MTLRRRLARLVWAAAVAGTLIVVLQSLAVVDGGAVPASPARATLHWTQLHPASAPYARAWTTMAYDAADGYVVLYGGYNAYYAVFNDTWTFKGGNWTQIFPKVSPLGEIGLTLVYDPTLGGVVTFGGQYAPADTWLFKAGNWSLIPTAVSPPARFGYSMAFDSYDNELVMFGGQAGNNTNQFLSDTWTFNGTNWAQVTVHHHPNGRIGASMVYDAATSSVLLVGGRNTSTGVGESGTWAFQAGVWNWLYSAHTPSARNFPFVAALGNGTPMLFGGTGPTGYPYLNGSFEFFGGAWHHVFAFHGPSGRNDAAMTWDGADGYMLMFGGSINNLYFGTGYTNETWTAT